MCRSSGLLCLLLVPVAVQTACKSDSVADTTEPAASASSPSPLAPRPSASVSPKIARRARQPAPPPEQVNFVTADGVTIGASIFAGGSPNAPAVVLAHHLAGTRSEWIPLIERLLPPRWPVNLIALDLRGHGESTSKGGVAGKLSWTSFSANDFSSMTRDVDAAIAHLDKRPGGPPSKYVFIGSDIGASVLVRASSHLRDRLAAVAVISPGASLRGLDLYGPFRRIHDLANLIVVGQSDVIAAEPSQVLTGLSRSSRLVSVPSDAHSAALLGRDHPEVWDDLADWVEATLGVGSMSSSPNARPTSTEPPRP